MQELVRRSLVWVTVFTFALALKGPGSAEAGPLEIWSWSAWGTTAYQQLGPINSYDVECVSRAPDRVDCMELVGRQHWAGTSPYGADTVAFRQIYWTSTGASGWFDNNLTIAASSSLATYGLSCTSWGADRIDCFAAPGWLSSGPLLHTSYTKSPVIIPPRFP